MQAQPENVAMLSWQSLILSDVIVYYYGFNIGQLPATSLNQEGVTLGGRLVVPAVNSFLEIQFEIKTGEAGETYRLPVYLGRTDAALTELLFSDIEEPGLARIRDRLRLVGISRERTERACER